MVSKKLTFLAVGVAAVLALAGCSNSSKLSGSATAKGDYTMYVNLALTGPNSSPTQASLAGLKQAVSQVNAEGGILGQKVKVVVADDQNDTTKAVTLFTNYMSSHPVPQAVFVGNTSNEGLAMLPLVTRDKLISMGSALSAALNDSTKYPYAFWNYTDGDLEANAIAQKAQKAGYNRVALIAANDALGQNTQQLEGAAFKKANIQLDIETYTPGDVDMTSQLQRLKADNPDVLLIEGFGAFAGHVLTSRTKLGWTIPTIGLSSLGNGANLGVITTPADWTNLKVLAFQINTGAAPNGNRDVLNKLKTALKKAGSQLDQPLHSYTTWWDMVWQLKIASEQAKSVAPDKVKAALDNLKKVADSNNLLTFKNERYSKTDQFVNFDNASDAFVLAKPGPLVEGVIVPPGN